jgi:hypothetical protein
MPELLTAIVLLTGLPSSYIFAKRSDLESDLKLLSSRGQAGRTATARRGESRCWQAAELEAQRRGAGN